MPPRGAPTSPAAAPLAAAAATPVATASPARDSASSAPMSTRALHPSRACLSAAFFPAPVSCASVDRPLLPSSRHSIRRRMPLMIDTRQPTSDQRTRHRPRLPPPAPPRPLRCPLCACPGRLRHGCRQRPECLLRQVGVPRAPLTAAAALRTCSTRRCGTRRAASRPFGAPSGCRRRCRRAQRPPRRRAF